MRFALTWGVVLGLAAAAAAQIDPRTALVERDAWAALNAGRPHEAAEAFRVALSAGPGMARLHLAAGTAAVLERRDDDGRSEFELALRLAPKLTEARAMLGQIEHRMGDVQAAIRTYETLVADAPADSEAKATLDRWRREVELHDGMQQAIGHHFTVSFEGPAEEALAAEALASLDAAYWRIGSLLGTYPNDPILVVLYTSEQFRDITRSPPWAAGAYDGTVRVPMRGALDNRQELDRVLAHEFTHALIRTLAARGVPTWLNEGLATALEMGDIDWARERISRGSVTPSLQALQSGFGRLSGAQAQVAYAISALAVRRMLDESGGFAVANLLRDLGDGADFNTAFLRRMNSSFERFQATPLY